MNSIFHSLAKYAPRGARFEQENFFTEAFVGVFVLASSSDLRVDFFEYLTGHCVDVVEISTQESFRSRGYGRQRCCPDICLRALDSTGQKHHVLIESKLESQEGEDQLSAYASVLRDQLHGASKTLVYVTKYGEDPHPVVCDEVVFRQRRWHEIHSWMKIWVDRHDGVYPLLRELLLYMEELNMTTDVKLSDVIAAVAFKRAESKLSNVIDAVWNGSRAAPAFTGDKKEGKWASGSIRNGFYHYSPELKETRLQIAYGLWLNTGERGYQPVSFPEPELPTLFVEVRKADENKETLEVAYPALATLSKCPGWRISKDKHCYAFWQKQLMPEGKNLGITITDLLVKELDRAADVTVLDPASAGSIVAK